MEKTIKFTLNGMEYRRHVQEHWTLLHFLRDHMTLTGSKEGCGNGECGACTVLIDQKPIRSCLVLVCEIDGCKVTTIEGLGNGKQLDIVQDALIEAGAVQCGFCTSGFIMAIKSLFQESKQPSREQIMEAFSGHLCRCTGYEALFQAVDLIIEKLKAQNNAESPVNPTL